MATLKIQFSIEAEFVLRDVIRQPDGEADCSPHIV
jgi:hypothetical protein